MSSGRLDSDGEPIINANNITKETKSYREFKFKQSWVSFELYTDYITRFWQISFIENKEKWQSSSCNCSRFQKDNICKHLLLQAIRYKYVEVPLTAQTVEFQAAPKRGRPAGISKALQIDSNKSSQAKNTKQQTQKRSVTAEPVNSNKKLKK